MHYIVGTSFTPGSQPTQRSGLKSVSTQQVSQTRGSIGPFSKGTTYTLYNIEQLKDSIRYTFVDDNRQPVIVDFKSTREADIAISKAVGEVLPDYKSFYDKMA